METAPPSPIPTRAAPAALELIGVSAGYGRVEVLHNVDLVVPPASIVAVLGANGAGKTTMMKVIDGRHPPSRGCVHIGGRHLNGASSDRLSKAGLCSIPEGRGIFPNLTVAENLRVFAQSRPDLDATEVAEISYTSFPRLAERRLQLAGSMSGGEQQMLALARAIATNPSVLLVDELSMGLAPVIVDELYDRLVALAEDGIALLLVEQFAQTALEIADLAAVMAHGRIVSVGEPCDLEDIADAYLGGS